MENFSSTLRNPNLLVGLVEMKQWFGAALFDFWHLTLSRKGTGAYGEGDRRFESLPLRQKNPNETLRPQHFCPLQNPGGVQNRGANQPCGWQTTSSSPSSRSASPSTLRSTHCSRFSRLRSSRKYR